MLVFYNRPSYVIWSLFSATPPSPVVMANQKKKDETGNKNSPQNNSNMLLQQALRIYEFAYGLYQDYTKEQPVSLQQTLSSRDSNNVDINDYEGSTEYYHTRAAENVKLAMIVTNNIGEIHRVTGDPMKHNRSQHHLLSLLMFLVDDSNDLVVLDSNEMDGFYHNLIPIILDDICAHIA